MALGKFAAQTLLADTTPITRLRGRWREYEGVPLMPTFHPAYLLRSPAEKAKAWEDLKAVVQGARPRAAQARENSAMSTFGDPYGLGRVVGQPGVLPQQADRLDPSLPLRDDELLIDVDRLNVDAASFRQLRQAAGDDPAKVGDEIARIVAERGKLQNPVTGSGGMLLGRVREIGPRHPARGRLAPGDRVATLVSLTLTPLQLRAIRAVDLRGRPGRRRADTPSSSRAASGPSCPTISPRRWSWRCSTSAGRRHWWPATCAPATGSS